MSVWKKAAKANQKTHRERHQPDARNHLGLLEKKSDYVKRARDFNEKRDTVKLLRKRALNRNPEEFYHHMINSKIAHDGSHHEKDTRDANTREQLQLMETQDVRYVNMKRTQETKRIERMQSQLHLIDIENKPKNTHKYFFETKQDLETFKEKKNAIDNGIDTSSVVENPTASMNRARENAYSDLATRIKRERQLLIVQQKLEIKTHLRTRKGCLPPKRIQAATKDTPPVYKWKLQRKR